MSASGEPARARTAVAGARRGLPPGLAAGRALVARASLLIGLLATFSAPLLHSSFSLSARQSATAQVAAGDLDAVHHGQSGSAPHDPARCPQCRAIAQARTLLQAPGGLTPTGPSSVLIALVPHAPEAPPVAPVLGAGDPRVPPLRSLSS